MDTSGRYGLPFECRFKSADGAGSVQRDFLTRSRCQGLKAILVEMFGEGQGLFLFAVNHGDFFNFKI
jgi:hypothetical protein